MEKALKTPENFFKHAARDPNEALYFAPAVTDIILVEACAKYLELTGEKTLLTKAYEIWFSIQHPELLEHTTDAENLMKARKELTHLSRLQVLTNATATWLGPKGATR